MISYAQTIYFELVSMCSLSKPWLYTELLASFEAIINRIMYYQFIDMATYLTNDREAAQ